MANQRFVSDDELRANFYRAMSRMYRQEVPLYGDLLDIVDDVNRHVLAEDPALESRLRDRGEYERLGHERHGAIRVGTADELSMMRRAFAVLGMHPVGYYDLSVAGVPVHSTAFRPISLDALNRNPFRIFTSLLRLELIEEKGLREQAARLLTARRIFSRAATKLIEQWESDGGLSDQDGSAFVHALVETFRWHSDTTVDYATYRNLSSVHRLVADVTCFRGPHINHLTPRTLDIDAAQREMERRGIDAKDVIEGPPRRHVPILLRQTSFKALEEVVRFRDSGTGGGGTHTARFGEIEQRGLALSRAGRDLYDQLLAEARGSEGSQQASYVGRLAEAFGRFPDDLCAIRKLGLGFFNYRLVDDTALAAMPNAQVDELVDAGVVEATPIVYEDFLPVSAAGVFQSNLGGAEQRSYDSAAAQEEFEDALGAEIHDPFTIYETLQARSLAAVRQAQELYSRPH